MERRRHPDIMDGTEFVKKWSYQRSGLILGQAGKAGREAVEHPKNAGMTRRSAAVEQPRRQRVGAGKPA